MNLSKRKKIVDIIVKHKSQKGSYVIVIGFGTELPSSQRKKRTKIS